MGFWPFQEGISTESRLANQGRAAWAASGVMGILKDLGYVPQDEAKQSMSQAQRHLLSHFFANEIARNIDLGSMPEVL